MSAGGRINAVDRNRSADSAARAIRRQDRLHQGVPGGPVSPIPASAEIAQFEFGTVFVRPPRIDRLQAGLGRGKNRFGHVDNELAGDVVASGRRDLGNGDRVGQAVQDIAETGRVPGRKHAANTSLRLRFVNIENGIADTKDGVRPTERTVRIGSFIAVGGTKKVIEPRLPGWVVLVPGNGAHRGIRDAPRAPRVSDLFPERLAFAERRQGDQATQSIGVAGGPSHRGGQLFVGRVVIVHREHHDFEIVAALHPPRPGSHL